MSTPRVGPLGVLSATGAMLYRDSSGNVEELAIGVAGQVLRVVGGIPSWQNGSLLANAFQFFTPSDGLFGAINSQTGIADIGIRNKRDELLFVDTAAAPADNENIVFRGVMPASYDTVNTIAVFVDWAAPAGILVGDVKWNMSWERMLEASDDIDVDSFAASKTVTDTTQGTTGQFTRSVISFTSAEADAIAGAEDYRFQLVRDANAVGDTLVGDVSVLRVGFVEL